MNRATPIVLFGILAAAYSAGELNSTLLNQLTGKMPQVKIKNLADSIVFIYDENGNTIGLGVFLEHGYLVSHTKFATEAVLNGVTLTCHDNKRLGAWLVGSYESVALMRVDSNVDVSSLPWATLVPKRPQGDIFAKSATIVDTKSLRLKTVKLISGWVSGKVHNAIKWDEDDFEKEGDLLFYGSAIIGILVQTSNSGGITTYQKLSNIRGEVPEHLEAVTP